MVNYYLGCDVSKGYADFIIIDKNKNVVERVFQIDDTFDGHNRLYEILTEFFKTHATATIYSAVESTGGLENNWLNLLYKFNDIFSLKAARLNPNGPVALHKASLERNGNDTISAKFIAEYLIAFPEKVKYNDEDPYQALRKQWNLIEMYKKQCNQLLNQLSLHLYNSLPFVVKYCKNSAPEWLLQFLLQYQSAKKIARSKETIISKIPYISTKRARDIKEAARQSIGSSDDEVSQLIIKSTVEQILSLKRNIAVLKKYLITHCDLPEVKLLNTIPGIGTYSAIGLILNIVSIERFPSAKHLCSYFGVHPVYKSSGDKTGAFRMSKAGRSAPRKILFMIALTAVIHNPVMKGLYIKHLQSGKSKMASLGVCMHKILRAIFGMLKHDTVYNP